MKRIYISFLVALAIRGTIVAPAQADPGRRFPFGKDNVAGWPMMNSAERAEYHRNMTQLRTMAECRTFIEEHHARMEQRARDRSAPFVVPTADVCAQMKARGLLDRSE